MSIALLSCRRVADAGFVNWTGMNQVSIRSKGSCSWWHQVADFSKRKNRSIWSCGQTHISHQIFSTPHTHRHTKTCMHKHMHNLCIQRCKDHHCTYMIFYYHLLSYVICCILSRHARKLTERELFLDTWRPFLLADSHLCILCVVAPEALPNEPGEPVVSFSICGWRPQGHYDCGGERVWQGIPCLADCRGSFFKAPRMYITWYNWYNPYITHMSNYVSFFVSLFINLSI